MPALTFHAPLLRAIAESLRLPPVSEIAKQPGVREVYRVTISYFDGRSCNSAATLIAGIGEPRVEVVYQKALGEKPLVKPIAEPVYQAFVKVLRMAKFDQMPDQPNLPDYNSVDLWLVERAAGTFTRSVITAPEIVDEHPQVAVVSAVQTYLPEALREVK